MLTVKNCTKSQKETYVLLETCVDDLETNDTIYIFDAEEDMMEKFEELKHQDIAFLIDEDRDDEIPFIHFENFFDGFTVFVYQIVDAISNCVGRHRFGFEINPYAKSA